MVGYKRHDACSLACPYRLSFIYVSGQYISAQQISFVQNFHSFEPHLPFHTQSWRLRCKRLSTISSHSCFSAPALYLRSTIPLSIISCIDMSVNWSCRVSDKPENMCRVQNVVITVRERHSTAARPAGIAPGWPFVARTRTRSSGCDRASAASLLLRCCVTHVRRTYSGRREMLGATSFKRIMHFAGSTFLVD